MKYKKVALIGMMGCGKSTIAKLLSEKLNIDFIDLDEIFETRNQIKIKDFFQKFGEETFRKSETELLKEFSIKDNIIISTGGGIIVKEENRNILFNQDIYTIYLKTSVETIYERIKQDKSRPLLLVNNPKEEIKKILNKREEYYNLANLIIETDNITKEEVAEIIWKQLI